MRYVVTDGADRDFVALCAQLDASLNQQAGGEGNRQEYVALNGLAHIHDVVVAYDGDTPVACGSFKRQDGDTAEIKRVFVRPTHRRLGLAQQIMARLEQRAAQQGYARLILETGRHMTPAVTLYHNLGYRDIPNYGPYADLPRSLCMEKKLV